MSHLFRKGKQPTLERIQEADDANEGWCSTCNDWTRGETEPDAEEYECPVCGENSVYGTLAVLMEMT